MIHQLGHGGGNVLGNKTLRLSHSQHPAISAGEDNAGAKTPARPNYNQSPNEYKEATNLTTQRIEELGAAEPQPKRLSLDPLALLRVIRGQPLYCGSVCSASD